MSTVMPTPVGSLEISKLPRREGDSKLCFCPSVRRLHIANNSRTRRPSVPKFGTKVLHHRLAYQFQGQNVKDKGHQAH